MSKQNQWERKLLDLSLRNNLLNLRAVKNLVPLIQFDLAGLENRLYEGSEFVISTAGDFLAAKFPDEINFSNLHLVEKNENLLDAKKLFAPMSEQSLKVSLTSLYRTSRSSIEESGTNTLYLAMGLLEWFDPKAADKIRYAPLILIPMEIVRQSVATGYKIRQRDEDAMINTTLVEFLKQDFGIRIEGLDPLPTDDNGLDIAQIFSIFEQAISIQPSWKILQSAYLGIFSFSQYVMWNDLRNRSEELAQNKIVRSLMDSRLAWEAESMQIPAQVHYPQGLVPISADASQLFAIQSASEGKSFVLHGPPGTGKSQTITGIIADALAQGKTVLFASEKMAALSVVQNRMAKLGLGDFCLELHSSKSKKKDVLSQLLRATERVSHHNPQEYLDLLAQNESLKQSLDRYVQALHQIRASGYSLYQMLAQYENNKNFADISMEEEYVDSITIAQLQEDLATIGELAGLAQSLGNLREDPLRFVGATEFDPSVKVAVIAPAEEYRSATANLSVVIRPFLEKIGNKVISHNDLLQQMNLLHAISVWNLIPSELKTLHLDQTDELRQIATLGMDTEDKKEKILSRWKESLFEDSGELLLEEWRDIQAKGFLTRVFSEKKVVQRLSVHARGNLRKEKIEEELLALCDYQKDLIDLKTRVKNLSALNFTENMNWQKLSSDAENLAVCLQMFEQFPQATEAKIDPQEISSIQNAFELFENKKAVLDQLLSLRELVCEDYFAAQIELCNSLKQRGDYIREWTRLNAKIHALSMRKIPAMAQSVFTLEHTQLEGSFKKSIFSKLIHQTLAEDAVLSDFSGAEFDVKVSQLKSLDKEFKEVCKSEIFYRLAMRVPDFTKEASQSSELGILQRALRSGGRGVSIRKLFQQIPTLLPRLCPCMLMSPISCAQYLDAGGNYFDLVIFDEASQLPTAKAVGVLARGKEAIIVGDPKQMPPTSFFGTDNIDEENLENEDLESILDDALALSMPQTHLLWHYRSRHESLIAFSNHEFYESKLYTFPSSDDGAKMVRFVASDGIFDRGNTRTNRIEAQKIVDEVFSRWQNSSKQQESIGIVTFNIAQQNLIEDLLEEMFAKYPEFDTWATQAEEPLFVKNLENVQGDERDVIFFSIGFGPDTEGKIYMNFGPLNQEGGWRRLNVAITRSRKEMVIFSSLSHENIDLSKTQSAGVAALRSFLEFAKTGQIKGVPSQGKAYGVLLSVSDFLQQNGYESVANLGQSKFKIDLAVIDPSNPEKYLLGILTDGGSYKEAKTTTDRELSSFSVLSGLGWNLHRLWSVDYWENPSKEQEKILALLKNIQSGEAVDTIDDSQKNISEIKSTEEINTTSQNSTEQHHAENSFANPLQGDHSSKISLSAENTSAQTEISATKGDSIEMNPIKNPRLQNGAGNILDTEENRSRGSAQAVENHASKSPWTQIPYQTAALRQLNQNATTFSSNKNFPKIVEYIEAIIEIEAPIHEDWLMKRVMQNFGIARSSSSVQETIVRAINYYKPKATIQRGVQYFWRKDQELENFSLVRTNHGDDKREITYIHDVEIQNAIFLVLHEQLSIPQDALIKEASKKLGFSRMSAAISSKIEEQITALMQSEHIRQHGEKLQLNNDLPK